jgi:hypothetical protein
LRRKRGENFFLELGSSEYHVSPSKTMYNTAFLLALPSQKIIFLPSFPQKIFPIFFLEMFGPAPLWDTISQ